MQAQTDASTNVFLRVQEARMFLFSESPCREQLGEREPSHHNLKDTGSLACISLHNSTHRSDKFADALDDCTSLKRFKQKGIASNTRGEHKDACTNHTMQQQQCSRQCVRSLHNISQNLAQRKRNVTPIANDACTNIQEDRTVACTKNPKLAFVCINIEDDCTKE